MTVVREDAHLAIPARDGQSAEQPKPMALVDVEDRLVKYWLENGEREGLLRDGGEGEIERAEVPDGFLHLGDLVRGKDVQPQFRW